MDYSQTRSFNLGIAKDTSVEAALIYDDLAYAQKMVGSGKWFYRSYEQLMNRLPYSEKTLRRHVDKLVEQGWVSKKVMKIDGTPVCHYQISRFLSVKMTVSKEKDKMTDSIYNNSNTTKKPSASDSVSFGADSNSADLGPASTARARALLPQLIEIINPKEKATADRLRVLNGRLKDYTEDEILGAARAFSQSDWHKKNKQMSVDNLIAPSKFGRWYTQRTDTVAPETPERDENGDLVLTQAQIEERLANEETPKYQGQ